MTFWDVLAKQREREYKEWLEKRRQEYLSGIEEVLKRKKKHPPALIKDYQKLIKVNESKLFITKIFKKEKGKLKEIIRVKEEVIQKPEVWDTLYYEGYIMRITVINKIAKFIKEKFGSLAASKVRSSDIIYLDLISGLIFYIPLERDEVWRNSFISREVVKSKKAKKS